MSEDTVTITIDDKTIEATAGQTILEAAEAAGIYIPRLCYYKGLPPGGHCRLCTVLVNGRPASACTFPVAMGQDPARGQSPALRQTELCARALRVRAGFNTKRDAAVGTETRMPAVAEVFAARGAAPVDVRKHDYAEYERQADGEPNGARHAKGRFGTVFRDEREHR